MKKFISVCIITFLFFSTMTQTPTGITETVYADDYIMTQEIVQGPNTPSEDNAYIIFEENPVMHNMSFQDGVGLGRYNDVTHNEAVKFDGVEGRQVWKENMLYMRLDPKFASPDDSVFKIEFDYWDYSGVGWLFLDYTTAESDTIYQRIRVLKQGDTEGAPRWHRVSVYVTDACFRQAMPFGCDLVFVTNAFNAFSKIEITNLSANALGNTDEIGVFNGNRADALHHLGLYDGISGEEYNSGLSEYLTQEEFIRCLYVGVGEKETVLNANLNSSVNGVSDECQPYVGYAQKQGILDSGFSSKSNLTQAQMLGYFAKIMGYGDKFDIQNSIASAREIGILAGNEAVFQADKNVTRDNFVGVLGSVILSKNAKGTEPIMEMMEKHLFTGKNVAEAGYSRWKDWILKRGFYNEPRKIVDETTGRTYYTLDLLGEQATKAYFAQGLTSADGTRFYFTDKDSNIYEHNIETNMTRYIDTCPYNKSAMNMNFVTTPQNNLWYINGAKEVIKMNCDTWEKVKVAEIPECQKNYDVNLLFVSYNEKLASVLWTDDRSGTFDSKIFGGFPTLNLETGEWDISHYYAFDYGDSPARHNAINPYYNYQVFCHEYTPVYDRVWVVNMDTDEYYNVSKQWRWSGIIPGESTSHEYWCTCGKHVCWPVNNPWFGRRSGPNMMTGHHAICDIDGTNIRYVGTINSNHASMSPNHRWIIGDDSENHGRTGHIALTDIITGDSQIIGYTHTMKDPGHAHPTFSWDNSKVFFGLAADDYSHAMVGWMDVSDIVNEPLPEGGEYKLSDVCDTFGYKGFEHYIEPRSDADGTYFHIDKGNKMYVQTNASVTEKRDANIYVKVTYLDEGKSDICIEYMNYGQSGQAGYREYKNALIKRNNTGKWKTQEVLISDVDMQNPFMLGADLLIYGQLSDANIRTVEVRVAK